MPNRGPARCLAHFSALAVLALPQVSTQSVKLNGPLVQPRGGDVFEFHVSADATRVVYRADQETDEVYELFSAPSDASAAPIRLNGALPPGGDVVSVPLLVVGRVVYRADQTTAGVFELYSVPADGSASPVRLNDELVAGGDVLEPLATDEQHVFFLADALADEVVHLFRVPADGSAPALDLTPGFDVSRHRGGPYFWLSPDGSSAAFTTSSASSETLCAVPADGGGAPVELAVIEHAFWDLWFEKLSFSADAGRIVFVAGLLTDDDEATAELYSVPTDGSQPAVRLNQQTFGDFWHGYEFDGQDLVAYVETAEQKLYSVRTDGTQRVQLNPPGWVIAPEGFFPDPFLASDASHVAFLARSGATKAVFAAPFDGSTSPVTLVPPITGFTLCHWERLGSSLVMTGLLGSAYGLVATPFAGGGSVPLLSGLQSCIASTLDTTLSADGLELVFRTQRDVAGMSELHAVPLDGSQPARQLNAPLIAAGDVTLFELSSDGERVVYRADRDVDETHELFGTSLDGSGVPLKYNPPMAYGPVLGDVLGFRASPDGSRVAFRADQDLDEVFELYVARSDGRGAPVRKTEVLGTTGDVLADFVFTPSGQRLVFQHDDLLFRLLGVRVAPGHLPLELDSSDRAFPAPFLVEPSGARIVYRKARSASDQLLRSALVDGSAPPVTLADPVGSRTVTEHQLAPSGDSVLYRADQDTVAMIELYRIALDGSGTPLQLNAPLVTSGDVEAFRIAPDSGRVVYRADQATNDVLELFSVPLDASSPAVKLNGALVPGGDVGEFSIASDAQRVVYRADQSADQQFELFSAPADGTSSALRLTVLPASSDVLPDFEIGPDGQAVFYRSNELTPSVTELFVVPLDGSASPLRLSGALASGGNVASFAVSPDGSRVVYRADQDQDERFELYCAPADGSGPALALDPLPSFADVGSFRIDPDSARVVYTVDRVVDEALELYAVALDGNSPPERVNADLPPGADVEPDFVALSAGAVLYRADQEANDALELYHFLDLDDPLRPSVEPQLPPIDR